MNCDIIPSSHHTVGVKIIDTTTAMRVPVSAFNGDEIHGYDFFDAPAHSFLIEHDSGSKLLFDLGLRTDIDGLSPAIQAQLETMFAAGASADAEKDVATILEEHGIDPVEVDAIIWSHGHLDHTGDPATFPTSTSLVVGPGLADALLPGYPADPSGLILESDYKGRELIKVDFDNHPHALQIGRYQSVDYFGDGSFYLLNSPGHTWGHMAALARTTTDSFILMGADTAHHAGALRPSAYHPLPKHLSPSPFSSPPFAPGSFCPGELLEAIHPLNASDKPYFSTFSEGGPERDILVVKDTVNKMMELDGRDDVFVVIAHDGSLKDRIDFFPLSANEWKSKGWKEEIRWKFLSDFREAAEATEKRS